MTLFILTIFVSFAAGIYFGEGGADLITLNLTRWDGKSWDSDT